MTAADRPSVTDDARAALARIREFLTYGAQINPREDVGWVRRRGYRDACRDALNCLDDLPDREWPEEGPEWAAGRAETTTATVATDAPALLAELERAQEREADAVQRAERAEALLATARTRPTRQQAIEAVGHDGEWCRDGERPDGSCCDVGRIADRVLALLADQPDPADVWDQAVRWARTHASKVNRWRLSQGQYTPVHEDDHNPYRRERAARLRGGDHRG